MKADLDLRKVFFQQVVLAGGSTLFPGKPSNTLLFLCRRLFIELYRKASSSSLPLLYPSAET
jgi:hypothetical protein